MCVIVALTNFKVEAVVDMKLSKISRFPEPTRLAGAPIRQVLT